ncbi:transposase [Methylobacterium sp. WL69]|uniref:Mu transposase C-terminal domain-containing protein n=1 Tax=Methylobacterium sp. WL69 TaxID=2603893 RepID=UPI0011CA1495|nr:Mu transposase C-terminal domain-containing protein [Methylobacterium sp. WL69]TXM73743.1 transposase [Methylobacterium sp. WL69]
MDTLDLSRHEPVETHDDVYLRPGDAIELLGKVFVVESRCLKPRGYVFSEPNTLHVEHPIASKDIKSWHAVGKLNFISKDEHGLPIGVRENLRRSLRAFTLTERKEIVRRLRYCQGFDDLGPGFSRSETSLQPVCDRIAAGRDDTGPHDWNTVYRWWKIWARAGRDPRALASNAAKRGNRKRKLEDYQLKAMNDAIESDFLRQHRPNATTAHKACIANIVRYLGGRDKALEVVAAMAGNKPPAKRSPFPSIKAFRAECFRQSRTVHLHRRHGSDRARQEMFPVGTGPEVKFPFQRVEADFKYLRLFVVDEDKKLPLGTPYLMAAIDCYSGCIAGWDVSFDPPSYVSAARTLKHLIGFKDMTEFAKGKDGEPIVRNAYPLNGVPAQFVLDNDQVFHSRSFVHSARALGCSINYIPPSQSWKKGRIERFWGTVQQSFLDMFPGKVFRYGDDVGRDYKPEDDAIVTLSELRLFITKAIVDVYHQDIDPRTQKRRIDLWTEGAAVRPPRRVRAHDDLVELVGAYETRKAERRGLRLFGLRYNSSDLASYRDDFRTDPRVEVRYDPQDIGSVTLIDHEKGLALRVPCTQPAYAAGLSLHQHKVIQRRAKDGSPEGRIRMGTLLMAKAELFELGEAMLKVRKGRRRMTKVAQFLGRGREVIDMLSRTREDPKESANPIDLSGDVDDEPEDDIEDDEDHSAGSVRKPPRKTGDAGRPKREPKSPKVGKAAVPDLSEGTPAPRVTKTVQTEAPGASTVPTVRKMKVLDDD